MIRSLFLALCAAFSLGCATAQTYAWQPSPGHTQIPIWPVSAPDPQPVAGPETAKSDAKDLVAGKSWTYVENVTTPTMTVYSPTGASNSPNGKDDSPNSKNEGAAVIVFPGGGYQILAIDLEGSEVCDWLTQRGITCVLLKYRVTDVGPYPKSGPYPESPIALEDAQRTVGLVRLHAAEWHIDPRKIGVLGFSAGGHLVAAISTHFTERLYPAVDDADKESCRPDFAIAIYPGHLWLGDKNLELNPAVPVTSQTPPTFLLQAEDDHVDGVNQSLVYYIALKNAAVPVEMHLYAQGNHAFGLRHTKLPITDWPRLVETWLQTIGIISE